MNTKHLIAAAALAFAGSAAFAQSTTALQHVGENQASKLTRAEVRNEVLKAQANGELGALSEVVASSVKTGDITRADVRADVQKARMATLAQPAEVRVQAGY